jgi:hypothetical protein
MNYQSQNHLSGNATYQELEIWQWPEQAGCEPSLSV